MQDGHYTYYTIQHRRTHESPWLKPTGPLKYVGLLDDNQEWGNSSHDYFQIQATDETHNVFNSTGHHGWWELLNAIKVLKQVRLNDQNGVYDNRTVEGHHQQALRHEYRLIKIVASQQTTPVSIDDIIAEVACGRLDLHAS